jgi:RNA polymerase sigma factor (sigma-70 family)
MTTINRNSLILDNIQFAKDIAWRKHRKYSFVSYDEIESAAYMGLVEAAEKYDPLKCDEFAGYAYPRIVGAICDFLREIQWGTRDNPRKATEIFEDDFCQVESKDCDELFEKVTLSLAKHYKAIVKRYYIDNKKIREIAEEQGVNESRISQVLCESRSKLKQRWLGQETDLWAEVA